MTYNPQAQGHPVAGDVWGSYNFALSTNLGTYLMNNNVLTGSGNGSGNGTGNFDELVLGLLRVYVGTPYYGVADDAWTELEWIVGNGGTYSATVDLDGFNFRDPWAGVAFSFTASPAGAATPEPATCLIFGIGVLAAGACVRRKRK